MAKEFNTNKLSKIQKDQRRYAPLGLRGFWKAWKFPGFRFMFFFRLASNNSKFTFIGFIARIFFKRLRRIFGYQIPHMTSIGGGLFMGHYGGIVISNQAVIGEDCNIAQGVTIGRTNKGPRKGAPQIGDRVWVGPNAVIVGNVKIGNNVMIAPLTFVNMDIPDNCLAIGNPAKIIEGKTSEDYINFY